MSNWWDDDAAAAPAKPQGDWWADDVPARPSNAGNIPLDPSTRRVGEIYTDAGGRPRRWMGDSWEFGDAARETTVGEFAKGAGVDLLQGLTRVPEALADTIGWMFTGETLLTPEGKAGIQGSRDYLESLKPESYRGEQSIPIVQRDEQGGISGLGLPSAESVAGTLSQSAPQVPMFLAGGGGLRTAAQTILPNSPRLATALGYGGANAALVAPTGAEEVRTQALEAGATPEEADSAANRAMLMLAPVTAVTGGLGGMLSAGQGQASGSLARSLIGGFLADAPFEGAEEAAQSAITDIALDRPVDAGRALEGGAQGVIAGGLPGAAIAALETRSRPAQSNTEDSWYADDPVVEQAVPVAAVDVPAAATPAPPIAEPESSPAAAVEPVAAAPVEAVLEPASVEPQAIQPTEGRLEVEADTGRGNFRLVDEPAPAGADFSEFGQVRVIEAFDGDTKVGELLYANDGTPPTVNVEPEYQRRGIATAMYELAKQQGGIVGDAAGGIRGRAEQYRTPAGMAFRAGADPSRVRLAPAPPSAVQSESAPPPAASPQAVPMPPPASPPQAIPAVVAPSTPAEGAAAPTATKNRITETERVAEAREPILRAMRQSNEETISRAREAIAQNPLLVDEISARAPDAPISATEEAAMLIGKVEARNRREDAAKVLADPKATPERKAVAQREWDAAEADINRIDEANVARGSEWGRFGQFRQRLMAADFTLEAMESKLRRAKGAALTAEETSSLKALSEKLKSAETDLEAAREKLADYEQTVVVRQTIEQAVREATAQMKAAGKSGRSKLDVLKERADAARKRLAAAESVPSKRGQSGAVTNPVAMLADVIDIGAWHVANGASKLADWIKAMTADLGARFTSLQDRWPDLFAASRRANVPAKPDAPTTAEVLAVIDPAEVTRDDIRDLVMARIRAGERGADVLMKAVTADVKTVAPEMTEADVRQLFADYGKRASPTQDADRQTLRDLRTVVRLERDIAQAEAGAARKMPAARQRASEEVRQLRARLSDLLKQAGRRARTPEAEAAIREKRREVLAKQIADLEDMLATGRRPAKRERTETAPDLAARRDELQRELRRVDAAMRPRRSPDDIYQQRRGTSIAREIERVQARLSAGDYARSPRVPKALNESNQEAAYRLEKLRQEFRQRQFMTELQQRSRTKRYLDNTASGLNLARAVMTSFDLSALLRQGGFVALGHPVRAAESIPDMLKAFASEKKAMAVENDIKDRPNAGLYKRAGLQITDDTGSLSKMEEAYMTRFLNRLESVPGQPVKNAARKAFNVATAPVRGSARAYSTFLNKLRADSFDAMLASLQRGTEPTDTELKAIANYINVATGRGSIPGMSESAAAGLNTVFFAPKLVASRFQLLAGQPLYGGSNRTRAMIAQDYARYMTGVALVWALGWALDEATGGDDEDDRRPFIEFDPRSSSFGRMRFGDWFVDPLSGLAQVSTILARTIGGETKTGAGDVKPMRDNYRLSNALYGTGQMLDRAGLEALAGAFPENPNYEKMGIADQSVASAIGSFVRSKLAPVPGAVVNTVTAENMIGQATTPQQEAVGLVTPMTFGNVADAMRDNGVPGGTALTMAEILGMGVQFRDRSSFDAPDYANLTFEQKREYSAYLQRVHNMKQDIDEIRSLANSFPEDASPSDVRDAVQMKAEQLGIDGVDVAQYKRRTTARDESGVRKSGLKLTEAGNVQLDYDKGSNVRHMLDTGEAVNKINKQMEDFLRQPMTDEMIDKEYRKYVSEGDAQGDKMLVVKQMADERSNLTRLFMETQGED